VSLCTSVFFCLQVVDHYADSKIDLRLYMVMLALPLVLLNMIRNLKWLAPFSMIANLLMAAGVGITFYYVFIDLRSIHERPQFTSLQQLPLFFGTAIFALEGIGVVRKLMTLLVLCSCLSVVCSS
jgi:Transmembrane amino acid transporter protein.